MEEKTMNDIKVVVTRQDKSYEFGDAHRPEGFEGITKPSPVHSATLSFDAVRPFMSNKPLRRQLRHGTRRCCTVYLLEELDGGFSVIAADLPGVASQGDTEAEALANI